MASFQVPSSQESPEKPGLHTHFLPAHVPPFWHVAWHELEPSTANVIELIKQILLTSCY